jgi:hypothetical protein
MDPALAAVLVPEMLDGVRQVDRTSIDAGALERLVENAARGTNEDLAFAIFDVAGLLPDQHERCTPRSS